MSFMESIPRPVKTYHTKPYDRISKHHGFEGQGKTIVITGGASGLGVHFSTAFAATGAARVVMIARSAGPLQDAKSSLETRFPNTEFLTYQASITDHDRMTSILHELGTADVLVLNAALAHRREQATEISSEEMHDGYETNATAAFHLSKAFLALPTPASGRKTILNVSTAAVHLLIPTRVGYGSSKAAAVQIMQGFAAQFPDAEKVRIVSFHPGTFLTLGTAANFPPGMKMPWEDQDLPAYFALWLAGPESAFLHGRFLWANWDVDEILALKERMEKERAFLTIGLVM